MGWPFGWASGAQAARYRVSISDRRIKTEQHEQEADWQKVI